MAPGGESPPGEPLGSVPTTRSSDRPFGLFQSIALLLIPTCLLLPIAHGLGYWPQHVRVRVVAPPGARLAAVGERALDVATPTWVDHRVAWHVDGRPWSCPIEVAHDGGRLRGRLRGANSGGLANAHMPSLDHVESCDGSLWIRTIDRGIEVLAPQPGRAWFACELLAARPLRHGDQDEPPAPRWCRALPADAAEHRLASGAWTAAAVASAGTTVHLCEVPASEPFVQVLLDDSGFPHARLLQANGAERAIADGHRETSTGQAITVVFGSDADASRKAVRIRLQLRADAATGLVLRASRMR